ncbi:MAG TPA: hypothetical protein VIY86_01060, partial [Pirellulaceae bacterium]
MTRRPLFSRATILALLLMPCLTLRPGWADNFTWEGAAPSTNWESALNWAGTANAIPDDNTDSALVNSQNNAPTLTSNRTVGALTIRSGADVFTGNGVNNFALTVQESLTQNGRTLIENAGSSLTVRQSPLAIDLDTDDLIINSGGSLILNNGATVQVDRLAELNAGGQIAGSGILEVNGQDYFYNDGVMRASGGGTLMLQSNGLLAFDLDGVGENGSLIADNESTLVIPTATVGPFDGTMAIYQNGAIEISTPLQLADTPGSRIDFHGGNGTATLTAGWLTLNGDVHMQSGTAVLASTTFVGNSAILHVHQGAAVQFDAATNIFNPDS